MYLSKLQTAGISALNGMANFVSDFQQTTLDNIQ